MQVILDFLYRQKHLARKVFLTVIAIHFCVTFSISSSYSTSSFGEFAWSILNAPGYALGLILILNQADFLPHFFVSIGFSESFFVFVSSYSYGVLTGFLASRNKNLIILSVDLIILLLLFGLFLFGIRDFTF